MMCILKSFYILSLIIIIIIINHYNIKKLYINVKLLFEKLYQIFIKNRFKYFLYNLYCFICFIINYMNYIFQYILVFNKLSKSVCF